MNDIDWENLELSGLEGAPSGLLAFCHNHGIYTVGALLGATQGMQNPIPLVGADLEEAEAFLARLLEEVPQELLDVYRADQPDLPPPGVLENHSEDL